MAFPVPSDAIEQRLDLNQHLIHNPAATFFMRVEGDMVADQEWRSQVLSKSSESSSTTAS